MGSLITVLKGWVFDYGAKALGTAGAGVVLLDVINRFAENGEPTSFCFEISTGGALLVLAALAVFFAFRSTPPTKQTKYND